MKIHDFARKKSAQQKITMMTCYDYPSARLIAQSSLDCVLVGDSVAMAVHGYEHTIHATMEMMSLHTSAVARGLTKQFLISDLPFLADRISDAKTMENAQKLIQAGANALKIEGADVQQCNSIHRLVSSGVPVMGHIGLTPQSVHQLGGYRVQGRTDQEAQSLIEQAQALEAAGCFAIVLECVPPTLAQTITKKIQIPIIGIGSGAHTDGQVLVWHDVLGLNTEHTPRFVKQFTQGASQLFDAIQQFVDEVHDAKFPDKCHEY